MKQIEDRWKIVSDELAFTVEAANDGERGMARLFIHENRDRFCYDLNQKQWYEYIDHVWCPDYMHEVIMACGGIQEKYLKPALVIAKNRHKYANYDGKYEFSCMVETLERAINKLNDLAYRKRVCKFATIGRDGLGATPDTWPHMKGMP